MKRCALAFILLAAGWDEAGAAETWEETVRRAIALHSGGRLREAETALRQALRLAQHPAEKATTWNNLGSVHQEQGRCSEAARALEKALHIWEKEPVEEKFVLRTAANLQSVLLECGGVAEAEHIDSKYLGHMEAGGAVVEAAVLSNRGSIAFLRRRFEDAESLDRRSVRLYEQAFGPLDIRTGISMGNLAIALSRNGKQEEALFQARRSLEAIEQSRAAGGALMVKTLGNLGAINYQLGLYDEANAYYQRALAVVSTPEWSSHALAAAICESYAAVLGRLRESSEAKEMKRQAKAFRSKAGPLEARSTVDLLELSAPRR